MRQFGFSRVSYFGPSKNYVFKCVDKSGEVLVLKVFYIHDDRKEEDLSKAWREIAFHNYAGVSFHLPEVVSSAFESELGVYLLTKFKQMTPVPNKLDSVVLEKIFARLNYVHSIKPSALNPGLRARIFEEDLKNNAWITSALAESARFTDAELKKAQLICLKARENPLLSKTVLVHGDSRLQNFYLDSDSTIQLRDFEHSGINSPLLDWASLYLSVYPLGYADSVKELAMQEAGERGKIFKEAFSFMLLHRAASWVKFNVSFARDKPAAERRLDEALSFIGQSGLL